MSALEKGFDALCTHYAFPVWRPAHRPAGLRFLLGMLSSLACGRLDGLGLNWGSRVIRSLFFFALGRYAKIAITHKSRLKPGNAKIPAQNRYYGRATVGAQPQIGVCAILPANEVMQILEGSHEPQPRGLAGLGGKGVTAAPRVPRCFHRGNRNFTASEKLRKTEADQYQISGVSFFSCAAAGRRVAEKGKGAAQDCDPLLGYRSP